MKHFSLIVISMPLLFGAGCSLFDTSVRRTYPMVKTMPVPVVPMPSTTTQPEAPTPQMFEDESHSIRVKNMRKDQLLLNGFVVEGEGVGFESTIAWKLVDSKKNLIGKGSIRINQPDAGILGPFGFPALFDRVPGSTSGTLFVLEYSARDGSETHIVKIPVTFTQELQDVKVYFGNSKKNPNAADCSAVYPLTRRIPKSDPEIAAAAIQAMLKGLTTQEKTAGYYTSIPDGVRLQGAWRLSGVAPWGLDFSSALQEQVGGSCRVAAIRSQIVTTAVQGTTSPTPRISIEGRSEDILQP